MSSWFARRAVPPPVVLYLDALEPGGTAAYGTDLALRMQARGLKVHVLCANVERGDPGSLSGETYAGRLRSAGIAVHVIPRPTSVSLTSRMVWIWRLSALIRSLRRPTVILVMGYIDGGGPAAIAARLARARSVVRAELQPPMPPLTARDVRSARLRDRLVDVVVVGSRENERMLHDVMGRAARVAVINTGIDVDQYVPGQGRESIRRQLGVADGELVVGAIARLVERKGVRLFVDAALSVASTQPSMRFLVVGDGPERNALEQRAAEAGPRRFIFTGYRTSVRDLLAAMDVFVMPSTYEGGPIVLLEAMAMGLPVISTRVGMAPEVIQHGRNGMLIDPGDSEAIADAITTLASSAELLREFGQAARETISDDLTLDAMVDAYLSTAGLAASFAHRMQD